MNNDFKLVEKLDAVNPKNKQEKDLIHCFLSILQEEAISREQPEDLRFDVLRSILQDNPKFKKDFYKFVDHFYITLEVQNSFNTFKNYPFTLKTTVKYFHTLYKNFPYIDIVSIQKEIFADNFYLLENETNLFIENHIFRLLTQYLPDQQTPEDFFSMMENKYKKDFKDYYYFPSVINGIEKAKEHMAK